MYIYHIAVLVKSTEDLEFEDGLETHIQKYLNSNKATLVSAMSEELIGNNYGCCVKCGTWVSDATKNGRIRSFSNGAQVNGNWYCDLCLPPDHPNSF